MKPWKDYNEYPIEPKEESKDEDATMDDVEPKHKVAKIEPPAPVSAPGAAASSGGMQEDTS